MPANCRNCAAPLMGPYCAQCGQHAHDGARSLGALLTDAWHVISHLDGRAWSTLALLLARPGQLTLEYFAERRARYVAPVRLYLVISIVFFGLASLTAQLRAAAAAGPDGAGRASAWRDAFDPDAQQAGTQAQGSADKAAEPAAAASGAGGADFNFDLADCDKVRVSPRWLEAPLANACRRNAADGGRTLMHAFVANVPKMMFVFLPLAAFVMQLLYWFPRRYYVEHLVLLLHNHAALFLAMALQMLLGALAAVVPALGPAASLGAFAVFCYALWYVYRSMRRYYGQGRWLTLAKLAPVSLAYLLFLVLTMAGTFLVSTLVA